MNLNILYEDSEILVCEKPAGIATQSSRVGTPDMVSLLKNYLRQQSPQQQPYLAVIHRLDQPVTGLLVFAKSKRAAADLNKQLTAAGFGKHYLALLTGIPSPDETDLTNYLIKDNKTNTSRICTQNTPGSKVARLHYKLIQKWSHSSLAEITDLTNYLIKDNKTNTSRICTQNTPGSKVARLHYKLIQKWSHSSLAEITLDTGRHHQIRVQMAHLGCPIQGDVKYGATVPGQLQLYAYRLTFRHPVHHQLLEFTLDTSHIYDSKKVPRIF